MTSACEVWFYHLERSGVEETLPVLLEKTLARGWRALVRAPNPQRLEELDQMLWTWRDDSFLPHGLAGEPHADRQPILLADGGENLNAAQALFLVGGSAPGALTDFERCILLFDGRDPEALTQARAHWKSFQASGAPVSYWKEDPERGWTKQG